MVSDTFEPTRKERKKATSAAELQQIKQSKYSLKRQAKDLKRLPKSQTDFASLQTLPQDSKRLQNHGKL